MIKDKFQDVLHQMAHFIFATIFLLCLAGCSSYSIHDADSITYSRKSIFSSGKVKLGGVKTEGESIKIKTLNAAHSNGYFSIDVEASNVTLSKEQLHDIINK